MTDPTDLRRILTLDDDADLRKLIKTYLAKLLPDAAVEEYDPVAQGVPREDFDWGRYDVLILDYYLCIQNVTGLDILQAHRKNPAFPATIMLTGAGTEEIAIRALKAGVYDYLRKEKLDKEKLKQAILDAFDKHKVERKRLAEQHNQNQAFDKAIFYQELEEDAGSEPGSADRVLTIIQIDNVAQLEERIGVILLDNIVKHAAKQCYDVFLMGECNPQVTRLTDTAVAMLVDNQGDDSNLRFNIQGLCTHMQKHPYKFQEKKLRFTVSIGAVAVPRAGRCAEVLLEKARVAAQKAALQQGNSFYVYSAADEPPAPEPAPAPEPEPAIEIGPDEAARPAAKELAVELALEPVAEIAAPGAPVPAVPQPVAEKMPARAPEPIPPPVALEPVPQPAPEPTAAKVLEKPAPALELEIIEDEPVTQPAAPKVPEPAAPVLELEIIDDEPKTQPLAPKAPEPVVPMATEKAVPVLELEIIDDEPKTQPLAPKAPEPAAPVPQLEVIEDKPAVAAKTVPAQAASKADLHPEGAPSILFRPKKPAAPPKKPVAARPEPKAPAPAVPPVSKKGAPPPAVQKPSPPPGEPAAPKQPPAPPVAKPVPEAEDYEKTQPHVQGPPRTGQPAPAEKPAATTAAKSAPDAAPKPAAADIKPTPPAAPKPPAAATKPTAPAAQKPPMADAKPAAPAAPKPPVPDAKPVAPAGPNAPVADAKPVAPAAPKPPVADAKPTAPAAPKPAAADVQKPAQTPQVAKAQVAPPTAPAAKPPAPATPPLAPATPPPAPVAPPPAKPVAAEAAKKIVPPPAAQAAQSAPVAEAKPEKKPEPEGAVLDEAKLSPAAKKLKQALDQKRVVQLFEPVISLVDSEQTGAESVFKVRLRLVDANGSVVDDEDAIYRSAETPEFLQFIDRWLLREALGRVVNNPNSRHVFILKVTAASLADPTLFNFLRKLLHGLDQIGPGKFIALEITLDDYAPFQKQAGALMSYLSKTHGFRFVLFPAQDPVSAASLVKKDTFDLLRLHHSQVDMLQGQQDPQGKAGTMLDQLSAAGALFIVDGVEDATMLTKAIGTGAAYAMGRFIGEPISRIDDQSNVESFEIT